MVEHTNRAFDTDLQTLALKIAEMSRLDEAQIRQSIEAIVTRDVALAKSRVNRRELAGVRCQKLRRRGAVEHQPRVRRMLK